MGRAKGRKVNVDRHNPIAASNPPTRVHAARKAAAKPFLAKLASGDAKERAESVSAIGAMLLEDKDFRKLLIKEDAVRLLLDRLSDDSLDVRVEASGALRNLCLDEEDGQEMCEELYKRNILTLIAVILDASVQSLGDGKSSENKLRLRLAENAIAIVLAFCETSDKILQGINQSLPNAALFLVQLIEAPVPASTRLLAAQCLTTLTDDNAFAAKRLQSSDSLPRLIQLAQGEDQQLATVICASLQSLAGQSDPEMNTLTPTLLQVYSKAIQDERWTTILSLEADAQSSVLGAVEVALEGLARLASSNDDDEQGDVNMDVEETHDVDSLMHLVHLSNSMAQLATPFESASAAEYPAKLQNVHLLALDALHNLAWTIISADAPALESAWHTQAADLWVWASGALPKWLQLGEDMADSAFSLLYGIAKSLHGCVSATSDDVNSLIKLYNATLNATVQAKIVGLVGSIGQAQGRIDVNKAVGTFLVTLVASYPRSDAECVLEALDALFDIYADAAFDYDLPVFVQGDFVGHLERCIPRARQLKASLNKQRNPQVWYKADEALDNLVAFVDYKRNERS